MRRSFFTKPIRMIAGLCTVLFFAISAIPLSAQPGDAHSQVPVLGYDKAHEITLNGTVNELVTSPGPGSPAGLHVLVNAPEGMVDTHLGPYMTKQTQEVLKAGTPVQIVGAFEKVHGKEYLLARQVIFSGRLVTVRNLSGFLKQGQSERASRRRGAGAFRTAGNGGAR